MSCVINDVYGKHNYKKLKEDVPLYGPGNTYNDGLSFDLLFEGYTSPRSCALRDNSGVLGAALELDRSTSPNIFGRE